MYVFFFFKQRTAYELRISDWSSDVCSSDLFQGHLRSFINDAFVYPPCQTLTRWRGNRRGAISITSIRMSSPGRAYFAASVRAAAATRDRRRSSMAKSRSAALVRALTSIKARSEEHTSELHSLIRISYAVFCLIKNTYH